MKQQTTPLYAKTLGRQILLIAVHYHDIKVLTGFSFDDFFNFLSLADMCSRYVAIGLQYGSNEPVG